MFDMPDNYVNYVISGSLEKWYIGICWFVSTDTGSHGILMNQFESYKYNRQEAICRVRSFFVIVIYGIFC